MAGQDQPPGRDALLYGDADPGRQVRPRLPDQAGDVGLRSRQRRHRGHRHGGRRGGTEVAPWSWSRSPIASNGPSGRRSPSRSSSSRFAAPRRWRRRGLCSARVRWRVPARPATPSRKPPSAASGARYRAWARAGGRTTEGVLEMSVKSWSRRRAQGVAAIFAVLAVLAAACSSSKSSSSTTTAATATSAGTATTAAGATTTAANTTAGNTASAPGVTTDAYTVGVVVDETGVAASNDKGYAAFKARIDAQNAAGGVFGRQIKLVFVDGQSSATQNLTAVQKIVLTSNPFVMVDDSYALSSSYRYLVAQKIPTVTGGYDGPEYADAGNEYLLPMLVGNIGNPYPPINTIIPNFMKQQGVTKGAGLGYSISPSSSAAAKNLVDALTYVGLPGGYVNTAIPFGGENVGSVILAMKSAGVNGAYLAMDNNTNFAIANSALQNGLTLKALVMATGYDQNLLSNPTTLATAEKGNVYISSNFVPYEAATPGVNQMRQILQQYANIPTSYHIIYGYWVAYGDAQLLIDGLMAAGRNPTRQGFVDAVRSFTNYTADGLFCSGVNFSMATYGQYDTGTGCSYEIKVANGQFVVVGKVTGHNVVSSS